MKKLNFKLRILICFALAAILPFIISWFSIYHIIDSKLQRDLADMNKIYVQNQVSKIDDMFRQQERILESIAKAYSYISDDESIINTFLSEQKKVNKHFNNLYIVKSNGRVFIGDDERPVPSADFTASHTYLAAKKTQALVWLEPYTDILSNERSIGIAMPVVDSEGKDEGVLIGNISIEDFGSMLAAAKYMPEVRLLLLNPAGYVKYDSENKYSESVNITDESFILKQASHELMSMQEGSHQVNYEDKNWLCIFSQIKSNKWKVISIIDTVRFKTTVGLVNREVYNYLFILGVLTILLVSLLSMLLSNSISRPLLRLRDGTKALSMGYMDYKIEVTGSDEINELAQTFNEMASNLKKSYEEVTSRTDDLYRNNQYLQEINSELEASYQQLGAAMSQLNESEEKYRKLMNNISDMVLAVNTENKIIYANSKLEKILGYTELELLGQSAGIIISAAEENNPFKAALEKNYTEYQLEMVKRDGTKITVEGSAQAIVEEEKLIGVQAIARDVTQKKLMEQQLSRKYNELQVLNRVSKAIANTLELNVILHTIVNQVIDISEALVCSIRLLSTEKTDALELKAIEGVRIQGTSIEDIIINKEIMSKIVSRKQSITIELKEALLPNDYMKRLYSQEHARYVVFNPLVIQGSTIGVMSTTTRVMPSYDQVELLTSLANNIAIAIDNARAYENLKHSYLKTVQSLVSAVEAKDLYTESHSIRVAKYSCFIAAEMGFSKSFIEDIWVAGVLHDIGKIGISDSILNKKDRLTNEEYELIKQHPSISYKILSKIGLKQEIMEAVRCHHERYDGRGYPDGIQGSDITVMAAIISIADAFDAITSERSYKKAKTIRQGINEIVIHRGMQFDPKIVDIFERAFLMKADLIEKIYNNEEVTFF